MPKLPNLNAKKVMQVLAQNGFELDHTTGSHYIFFNQEDGRRVVVPFHKKDLPKGTLHAIIKQSGLEREDF